jgi:glycosyltransferase involved in cell wall biosynthesis
MTDRTFFVVFENFEEVHLNKDVGAVPKALSSEGFRPVVVTDRSSECNFEFVKPVLASCRISILRYLGVVLSLRSRAKRGDLINLYHLSVKTLFQVVAIRALLPTGVLVWIKLDMNTSQRTLRIAKLVSGETPPIGIRDNLHMLAGRLLCKFSDFISTESTRCFEAVSKWPITHAMQISNGVFKEDFLRQSTTRSKFVTCIARHGDPNKRSEELLLAFAEAKMDADWKLQLIGPVTDDFILLYTEVIKNYPGMRERVILRGNISDRKELIASLHTSKIFVLLSKQEGFSLALTEAAAAGCYCIATDVGGAADVIKKNGVLLDPNFSQAAIIRELENAGIGLEAWEHDRSAEEVLVRLDWNNLLAPLVNEVSLREAVS